MKKILIKSILILIVAYISTNSSLYYVNHPITPLETMMTIWTMFLIIPGFLCGVILGYDAILDFIRDKSKKFDLRYFGIFILLMLIVVFPYLMTVFHVTIHRTVVQIIRVIQTGSFSPIVSLLAGYTFTQAFVSKK